MKSHREHHSTAVSITFARRHCLSQQARLSVKAPCKVQRAFSQRKDYPAFSLRRVSFTSQKHRRMESGGKLVYLLTSHLRNLKLCLPSKQFFSFPTALKLLFSIFVAFISACCIPAAIISSTALQWMLIRGMNGSLIPQEAKHCAVEKL